MRLDHVQLAMPVNGEATAAAFFIKIIGMQQVDKPEPLRSRGGCWFTLDSVQLHLGVEDPFTPQKKAHPAFCLPNLDDLADRLAAAGYPVDWDDSLQDRKRFYTQEPFGNRMEFMLDGDGFTQR
jgi:catechol 2,3-dioxygenase-like lactoylglutathione lyase family enzyme